MSAHTPGPWSLELVQEWPFGVRVTAGDELILSQSAVCNSTQQETRLDCEMGYGFYENATEVHWRAETARKYIAEQDANARLISAAPELLESAKELAAHVREMCRCLSIPEPAASLERYEAAIAKAGGAA
jgi:hypothetical protein